jgi:multidrug efflux pump subunit AcrA (membrane-fusion protein)
MKKLNSHKNTYLSILAAIILLLTTQTLLASETSNISDAAANKLARKTPVVVIKVLKADISKQIITSGDILPEYGVDLHPETAGPIVEIKVSEGSKVSKGQNLAVIDNEVQKARLEQAKASVTVAKAAVEMDKVQIQTAKSRLKSAKAQADAVTAQVKNLRANKGRLEKLFKEGAISKQQLDNIRTQYDATKANERAAKASIQQAQDAILSAKMTYQMKQAQLTQAKANLIAANVQYEDCFLKAPFEGIITKRNFDPGSMANPAAPVFRLEKMDPVKIVGSLIEKDLLKVTANETEALIKVDTFAKTFKSKVAKVYPAINKATRTGQFELKFANPDLNLRSGMFASIKLLIETRKNATIIPRDALLRNKKDYFAFKVENGKAIKVQVKTGLVQEDRIEITEGLKPDDVIICQGLEFIKSGTPVKTIFKEQ